VAGEWTNAFFSRLPKDLTAAESELRDHLLRAASVAKRVLPPGGAVSLQEWVERRMRGELTLGTNSVGKVVLKTTGPPVATGGAGPAVGPSKEAFFQKLPAESFLPAEEQLRQMIINMLEHGQLPATKIMQDRQVAAAANSFLPRTVQLADWVERRIGAEVTVTSDQPGAFFFGLVGAGAAAGPPPASGAARGPPLAAVAPAREDRREDFFAGLPQDDFSPEEAQLRSAIFDFLASWKSQELASISHMGMDEGVQRARSALLPQWVTLRQWIERRIGGEVELRKDSKGEYVVHLTQAALAIVSQRFRETSKRETPGTQQAARSSVRETQPEDVETLSQKFFEGLPQDELTAGELALRQELIRFLEEWSTRKPNGPAPILSDALIEKAIQSLKTDLLPKGVPLKDWIDRRIGGEIDTRPNKSGQIEFLFRNSKNGGAKRNAADMDSGEHQTDSSKESHMVKRDAFFANLPADGFTPEEELLREALLDYIANWKGEDSPTFSYAGGDPKVKEARMALLPKGCGVTLGDWIDQRIGGEVETVCASPGSEIYFDLRGQVSIGRAKKRKFDGGLGGPEAKGKGKGGRGAKGSPDGQGAPWKNSR